MIEKTHERYNIPYHFLDNFALTALAAKHAEFNLEIN
jgi:hypothetical protein